MVAVKVLHPAWPRSRTRGAGWPARWRPCAGSAALTSPRCSTPTSPASPRTSSPATCPATRWTTWYASRGRSRPWALERLARGTGPGAGAVHAAGVVHRDLKPGNVMLHDGDPVVIDFGIAHTGDSTRLTQTGMFMGTPGYLAPEVIEGQPSSEASDVHSWGATVAFAATGRPPFGNGSFETVFYRIVQGNADLAGIPGPLSRLVSAALGRDPRGRPTRGVAGRPVHEPGLAEGPPLLRGATTQAPAYGSGVAYGAAAAAASYGAAGTLNPAGPGSAGPRTGPGPTARGPTGPPPTRPAASARRRRSVPPSTPTCCRRSSTRPPRRPAPPWPRRTAPFRAPGTRARPPGVVAPVLSARRRRPRRRAAPSAPSRPACSAWPPWSSPSR